MTMLCDITLRIQINDPDALARYVQSFIEEYGLTPEDVASLAVPDLLRWCYDTGVGFPGTTICQSTFAPAKEPHESRLMTLYNDVNCRLRRSGHREILETEIVAFNRYAAADCSADHIATAIHSDR